MSTIFRRHRHAQVHSNTGEKATSLFLVVIVRFLKRKMVFETIEGMEFSRREFSFFFFLQNTYSSFFKPLSKILEEDQGNEWVDHRWGTSQELVSNPTVRGWQPHASGGDRRSDCLSHSRGKRRLPHHPPQWDRRCSRGHPSSCSRSPEPLSKHHKPRTSPWI